MVNKINIFITVCIFTTCGLSDALANNPRYGDYYPPTKIHCVPKGGNVYECDIPGDVAPYLREGAGVIQEDDYFLNYGAAENSNSVSYRYLGSKGGMAVLVGAYTGITADVASGEWFGMPDFLSCSPAIGSEPPPSCPFTNVPFLKKPHNRGK